MADLVPKIRVDTESDDPDYQDNLGHFMSGQVGLWISFPNIKEKSGLATRDYLAHCMVIFG